LAARPDREAAFPLRCSSSVRADGNLVPCSINL
jgi:hypothetical protein